MSQDVLREVLDRADRRADALFGADEVALWPEDALAALTAGGLLRETAPARSALCDGCQEACLASVEYIDIGDGSAARPFFVCSRREDMEPMEVQPGRLRRWAADLTALAENLARDIRTIGRVDEISPGRLWALGRTTFHAGQVDVFLARDAATEDGVRAINAAPRFQQCSRGLVLTLCDTRSDLFPEKTTLSLLRLLSMREGGLWLDLVTVESEVARAAGRMIRQIKKFPTPPGTTWEQVSIAITADGDGALLSAGGAPEPWEIHEMGLTDSRRRQPTPSELWKLLLVLAKEEILTKDSPHYSRAVPKRIERLREVLQELFGMRDDPFEPYHLARADRCDGYRPRFALYRITYRDD